MGILFSFSLAKREDAGDGFLSPIQYFRRVFATDYPKLKGKKLVKSTILVIAGAIRRVSSERQQGWSTHHQLLSHIGSFEDHLDDLLPHTASVLATEALFCLGRFCDQFGQHDRAIRFFKNVLNTEAHLSTLTILEGRDGISSIHAQQRPTARGIGRISVSVC